MQELWTNDFAANLYDSKEWFRFAKNWSSYMNATILHVPQAASAFAAIGLDATTVYPVATNEVAYTDLTVPVKRVAAPPRFVRPEVAEAASFDTRSAEMADIVGTVKQAINIEVAYGWQPAATATNSIMLTTGAARTNVYGKAGKLKLTFANILAAKAALSRTTKNTNMNNLYLIVDQFLYSDILSMPEFLAAERLATSVVLDGYVGKVAGVNVIVRNSGIAYTAANAKPLVVDYTDTYNNTHNSAALLVDGSMVGYGVGTPENGGIKMGIQPYAPGFYNDVLQGHSSVAAAALYAEALATVKGVVAIIEG